MDFTPAHGKADMINRRDTFECLREIPNLKNVLVHLALKSVPAWWSIALPGAGKAGFSASAATA
jgi:hypothetical protein